MIDISQDVIVFPYNKSVEAENSLYWSVAEDSRLRPVISSLNKIATLLQKHVASLDLNEKIEFSVKHKAVNTDLDVCLAICVKCQLRSMTMEQFQIFIDDIQRSQKSVLEQVDILGKNDTYKIPQVIISDGQQYDMTSEEFDSDAITVRSKLEKDIFDLAVKISQSNAGLKYKIDGSESRLANLPITVKAVEPSEPIVERVYVSYFDYVKSFSCVVFLSNGKRIRELRCDDPTQRRKLEAASKLKCEVDVRFATEVIKVGGEKPKTQITEILEVVEIYEDKKYPEQDELDF
jgi:hypothetical protein